MKLKIRLRNNKIITGALMSIALVNSGCNDFLNKVQPQGQESSITFMQSQDNVELAIVGLYNMLTFSRGSGPDGDWVDAFIGFEQLLLYTWLLGRFAC